MMARVGQSAIVPRGSALILTVVLTSLLAIVGVLFLMAARIDKMATSASSDERQLGLALDSVLALINEQLVTDVPGIGPREEYYDYPGGNDEWLADLEPYESPPGSGKYFWRQISKLASTHTGSARDVRIRIVGERDPITDVNQAQTNADADGDGVGDARWFLVPNVMSSRGKAIYATIRIVDNGGMLNVNTGCKFDPRDPNGLVDGTSQLQVNVVALASAPGAAPASDLPLLRARANNTSDPVLARNRPAYEREVIWKYEDRGIYPGLLDPNNPPISYTPFDFSDELELRYRWLLDEQDVAVRVERWGRFEGNARKTPVWFKPLTKGPPAPVPDPNEQNELDNMFPRMAAQQLDPTTGGPSNSYAYRRIATTYNMDRLIPPQPLPDLNDPNGSPVRRMMNVNRIVRMIEAAKTRGDNLRAATLYTLLQGAITTALSDPRNPLLQPDPLEVRAVTANLVDYLDRDDEVTPILLGSGSYLWGFEGPCIYISEVVCHQVRDGNDLSTSWAIELYKPYPGDRNPDAQSREWRLEIGGQTVDIDWSGTGRFHVLRHEDPDAPLTYDPNSSLQELGIPFSAGTTVFLVRYVGSPEQPQTVDSKNIPTDWMVSDPNDPNSSDVLRSLQRDISPHKCIWKLWSPAGPNTQPTLGGMNMYVDSNRTDLMQAHPANRSLTNVGELGIVFARNPYGITEGQVTNPAEWLLDLRNPRYARLLNYLTVIDPNGYGVSDPNETRIAGRININAAPWFVLAQLPWVQYRYNPATGMAESTFEQAMKIVEYRAANGAFESVAGLMQVPAMHALAEYPPGQKEKTDNQHTDPTWGPDLTPDGPTAGDGAIDDFEERDLILTRISNLVTVRSDVFTAYILVRIGTDGPQKRLVAVLDRSRVNSPGDRVRVRAQHLVPDPR